VNAHFLEIPPDQLYARFALFDELTDGRMAFADWIRVAASLGGEGIEHYDGYGRRVDRIVLPDSTLRALAEVEGRARLGAGHGDPFVFYAQGYLYGQNGEAGVVCSLGCTDGMVRVLEALGDGAVHRRAAGRIRGSTPGRVWHGAQFVTEAQGGSDVPANRAEAVEEGGRWRIYGRKWFCSNVNADYFLVTARARPSKAGDEAVSLFLVPAYADDDLPEGPHRGGGTLAPLRNGYTIDRLKDKLGTRELATAELTFNGAVAYPIGPLERGLSNLLRYVLTTSRYYCVQSAASTLRQAERIASAYADFRTAFGRRLADYPLVAEHLAELKRAHRRASSIAHVHCGLQRIASDRHPAEASWITLSSPSSIRCLRTGSMTTHCSAASWTTTRARRPTTRRRCPRGANRWPGRSASSRTRRHGPPGCRAWSIMTAMAGE
jgi:alkylation response protein AidB-like acyl-CoA dehydrogenase